MAVFTYDPDKFIIKWGPTTLKAFAPGDIVIITRLERKRFKTNVGAKGEVSRSRVRNDATNVKVRLKHTSPSVRELYLGSKLGVKLPFTVTEIEGGAFFYIAPESWIEEEPDPTIAAEEGVMEFMFGTGPAQFGQLGSISAS